MNKWSEFHLSSLPSRLHMYKTEASPGVISPVHSAKLKPLLRRSERQMPEGSDGQEPRCGESSQIIKNEPSSGCSDMISNTKQLLSIPLSISTHYAPCSGSLSSCNRDVGLILALSSEDATYTTVHTCWWSLGLAGLPRDTRMRWNTETTPHTRGRHRRYIPSHLCQK